MWFESTVSINQEKIKDFLLSAWLALFMEAQTVKPRQVQGQLEVGSDGGGELKATWNHGLSSRTEKGCDGEVRETGSRL